ncbi:MAG: dihydroorotate dehydrogenase electron transfer subunit [Oscillospiraceae bacterium]|nr:dihydroorotate dehydrogenase electron transfer subunit [Oscillospiraceae bacterium]
MLQSLFEIRENEPVARDVWRMTLAGDTAAITAPGQFVNVRLEGRFLRRPISVCDWREGELTIIYKVLGAGTAEMTGFPAGKTLDLLTGLGNGFDPSEGGDAPILIGGGVGVPPLYGLAKRLLALGKKPRAVLGFNTAAEVFYAGEFRALGCPAVLATADGSLGVRGFVTDALPEDYSYFFTCGPEAMLKAVYRKTKTSGQLSFERRMGCGFGACMGCSCKTVTGFKRICREGPVLRKEEIVWDD